MGSTCQLSDWGRYYVQIQDGTTGHSAGKVVYIDWPGWAGRSTDSDPEGAAALHFNADQKTYNVGDDIELNIPCSYDGRPIDHRESLESTRCNLVKCKRRSDQTSF